MKVKVAKWGTTKKTQKNLERITFDQQILNQDSVSILIGIDCQYLHPKVDSRYLIPIKTQYQS